LHYNMVFIPAGNFSMGSSSGNSDETPVHAVYLRSFWMDKYEVTNKKYKQFCDATGRSYPVDPIIGYFQNYPNYPVVDVTWSDAMAYAQWAGKRLPTEAEWEKAARGGLLGMKYPWGDENPVTRCNYGSYSGTLTNQMANFNAGRGTLPVGSFAANGYGLYDMAGNVLEWCADWYDGNYYSNSALNNPQGPGSGNGRVLRGGCWHSESNYIRCADRSNSPASPDHVVGFRCVI
jgi:formylglycine-generating enzyme